MADASQSSAHCAGVVQSVDDKTVHKFLRLMRVEQMRNVVPRKSGSILIDGGSSIYETLENGEFILVHRQDASRDDPSNQLLSEIAEEASKLFRLLGGDKFSEAIEKAKER